MYVYTICLYSKAVSSSIFFLHITETLRKYPSFPVLTRVCTKEIDLSTTNIRVPKGTFIFIPVLGVHRDPSIYPDPDKFDPERFNADKVKERHPCAYLAFGEGPRKCIDENLRDNCRYCCTFFYIKCICVTRYRALLRAISVYKIVILFVMHLLLSYSIYLPLKDH